MFGGAAALCSEGLRLNFMKSIASLFPNASRSTVAANPHLMAPNGGSGNKNDVQGNVSARRGIMNGVEREFALMLEAQKRNGEILRYEYEGMTLRWADMRYTPDFVVFTPLIIGVNAINPVPIKLIEVKGPHIHYSQQAVARFKGCRAFWPEFQFEMYQKTKEGWIRKQ